MFGQLPMRGPIPMARPQQYQQTPQQGPIPTPRPQDRLIGPVQRQMGGGVMSRLFSPEMLPAWAAMAGGQTVGQSMQGFGMGAAQAMQMKRQQEQADQQKNQTLAFLEREAPEYADAVRAGVMDAGQAFGQALKDRQQPQREAPKLVELFDENTGLPYKATFNPETGEYDRVGGVKASSGMMVQTSPDGTVTFQQGTGVKPMKESQAKANIYASRAENSNLILARLEDQGTDFGQKLASNVPLVGNYQLTPEYRQYDQAKRDFVNAVLRQESGAVISDPEFANAERQYFPQPGDDPVTIEQKRRNREIAIKAIREASGRPPTNPQGMNSGIDNRPMSELSDQELEAIINGG